MPHMKTKDANGFTNILSSTEATYLISLAAKFCPQLVDSGRVDPVGDVLRLATSSSGPVPDKRKHVWSKLCQA